MPAKLSDLLLNAKLILPWQLQDALQYQRRNGGTLTRAIVSLRMATYDEIAELLARHYGLRSVDLDGLHVDPAVIQMLPAETARRHRVLPLSHAGTTLTIALADPGNAFAIGDIRRRTGFDVEPVVASERVLCEEVDRHYGPCHPPKADRHVPLDLGDLLLKEKMVSAEQLQDALDGQRRHGGTLTTALVAAELVSEAEIATLLSRHYGIPWLDLEQFEVDRAILRSILAETARRYQVLPLARYGSHLSIAVADPTNLVAIDDIKYRTGKIVDLVVVPESALEDAIERYYGGAVGGAARRPRLSVGVSAPSGGPNDVDIDVEAEFHAFRAAVDAVKTSRVADGTTLKCRRCGAGVKVESGRPVECPSCRAVERRVRPEAGYEVLRAELCWGCGRPADRRAAVAKSGAWVCESCRSMAGILRAAEGGLANARQPR